MQILKADGTFGEEIDTRGTNQTVFLMEAEQARFLERQNAARLLKVEKERELESRRQDEIAKQWAMFR